MLHLLTFGKLHYRVYYVLPLLHVDEQSLESNFLSQFMIAHCKQKQLTFPLCNVLLEEFLEAALKAMHDKGFFSKFSKAWTSNN